MLPRLKNLPPQTPDKFQDIFHTYYPVVCRQVTYLLGSTGATDDIVQETFLKLYYSPPEELTNAGGWLARVAANLCYNYLKSEKSRKQRESSSTRTGAGNVVNLEDLVLKNQEVQMVRNALQELNERDRLALLLKFSGYSYQEIAGAIEVEKSSVGAILARAQARFKRVYLSAEGGKPRVL